MRLVKETEGASHLVVGSYLQVRVPPDEAVSRDVLGEERIKIVVTTIIKLNKKNSENKFNNNNNNSNSNNNDKDIFYSFKESDCVCEELRFDIDMLVMW